MVTSRKSGMQDQAPYLWGPGCQVHRGPRADALSIEYDVRRGEATAEQPAVACVNVCNCVCYGRCASAAAISGVVVHAEIDFQLLCHFPAKPAGIDAIILSFLMPLLLAWKVCLEQAVCVPKVMFGYLVQSSRVSIT